MCQELFESTYHGKNISKVAVNSIKKYGFKLHSIFFSISLPAISLGQNLQTSNYFWENCFAVFISIYGLLLFLYFIGNAQTFMQMATEKAANKAKRLEEIEGEMRLIKPKVESWMTRNNLPRNMEERIISCIRQRLEENKDFDMDKLISHLSKDLVTKIKHHVCLPLLRKAVQNLENQGDQNLLAEWICKSLEPKYYNEDSEII